MNRDDVKKYQNAQLQILMWIDDFCKKNCITYYLFYGSLIGAIRHHGFIPWDADIDIAMFRDDYEKFQKIFNSSSNELFFLDSYKTEKNHIAPHFIFRLKGSHVVYKNKILGKYSPKYDGIYVDVFPIDKVNPNKKQLTKQIRQIIFLKRIISLKTAPEYGSSTSFLKKTLKNLISFFLSPLSFKTLQGTLDQLMQKYNNLCVDEVAIFTDSKISVSLIYPQDYFGAPRYVQFESRQLPIPAHAESILMQYYGDYQKLPPEDSRWKYLDSVIDYVDYGNTVFSNT